ncbi:hypothetical protein P8C59_006792 [Phyllachora maydis]|uniref:WSC domain-containing protein n=1 Tax=Phyllachora maydis TaxID=1825666 RepID=A0AAD9MH82_9PEZI|nr:hypothetical protein P8C59_006792 [Phyllachora maydis]
MTYCSSLNTATTDGNVSIYQSDGHCHDWCFQEQSYALAILNYQTCWCSDLVPDPAVQVPTSECSTPCPGYPSDLCGGGSGSNLLYGYLANPAVRPSGTSPVAAAKPSTTALPQSQPVAVITETQTVQNTIRISVTPPPDIITSASASLLTSSSTSIDSTPMPSTTTSPPTLGLPGTPVPAVIIQTVTADGQITTVTSNSSNTPVSASNDNNGPGPSSDQISSGAIGGICIAAIAAAAAVGALFLCLKRKRKAEQANAASAAAFEVASKRGSSAGMMATPRTNELSESRFAIGTDGRAMAENWEGSQPGRRRSTLMPVDPRLDFAKGVYARNENPSHESITSLQDNEDYSRRVHVPKPLRAVNPDPD